MTWKSKHVWFFSERPHCGLNIWATDYCVRTPEWWIEDNPGPSLLLPEAQRWRGWPWESEPKQQQRYPLSLMWKALDISESGVVLCLAFLPANWVCRNNLSSHIHIESPCFLERPCNNPVFLGAQCLCIAKAFVLLGTLFCWCTSCCSCSLYIPPAGGSHNHLMFPWGSMEESLGARRKTIAECLVLNPLLPPRSVSEVESSDACCDFVILLLRKLWLTSPVIQNELSDSPPPFSSRWKSILYTCFLS